MKQINAMSVHELLKLNRSTMLTAIDNGIVGRALMKQINAMSVHELLKLNRSTMLTAIDNGIVGRALMKQINAMSVHELLKLNRSTMLTAIDNGIVGRALKEQLGDAFPATRASEIIAPLLPHLSGLMAGVIERLPADVFVRTVAASDTVLGKIEEADESATLDKLAGDVAAVASYSDLWRSVEETVESLLQDDLPHADEVTPTVVQRQTATWHIYLLVLLRASLPSAMLVDLVMRLASVTTLVIVACAVLRTAYPAAWAELDELHVTPVELVFGLFGALEYLKRNTDD
jgi:hypothetical protein